MKKCGFSRIFKKLRDREKEKREGEREREIKDNVIIGLDLEP